MDACLRLSKARSTNHGTRMRWEHGSVCACGTMRRRFHLNWMDADDDMTPTSYAIGAKIERCANDSDACWCVNNNINPRRPATKYVWYIRSIAAIIVDLISGLGKACAVLWDVHDDTSRSGPRTSGRGQGFHYSSHAYMFWSRFGTNVCSERE